MDITQGGVQLGCDVPDAGKLNFMSTRFCWLMKMGATLLSKKNIAGVLLHLIVKKGPRVLLMSIMFGDMHQQVTTKHCNSPSEQRI
jgi:hypothetical protein